MIAARLTGYRAPLEIGVLPEPECPRDGVVVEVLACGDAAALERFKAWLHRGPSAAEVSAVACESQDYQHINDFSTR